jgi:hypothetical protein
MQATAFGAANQGSLAIKAYEAAIAPHKNDPEARRLILRRIKGTQILQRVRPALILGHVQSP